MRNRKKGYELLNEYYDKIYVITINSNLESRINKLKNNLLGLNYEIYMGVEGKYLTQDEISKIYKDDEARKIFEKYCKYSFNLDINRSFTLGEIGCTLSHMNIYKEMLDKGYERVLILEDDAKLMTEHDSIIGDILHEIPEDCDLFYWGYRWNDSESKISRIKRLFFITPLKKIRSLFGNKKNDLFSNERFPKPYKKHVWKAGYHCGGHGYGISKKGAQKIIEINTPIIMMPDQLFAMKTQENKLESYVSIPLIIREDQSIDSSIAKSI
jgi:GR25 family glycosyltransferase involved in LPS biosynthesis